MTTLNYNIPSFYPPIDYDHKIDPNAAWIRSKPYMTVAAGRNLLPPPPSDTKPKTPWGAPVPIWKAGQHVLVQLFSPGGKWYRAIVVDILSPSELQSLSREDIERTSPSRLEKMLCRYTVQLIDNEKEDNIANIWTEIEEKFLAPTHLAGRLKANAIKFKMGERVLVQMSDGDKKHTHIGHISEAVADRILRDKNTWHVIPRLYKVYINERETSGYWTAKSIIRLVDEPAKDEGAPPPPAHTSVVPSSGPDV